MKFDENPKLELMSKPTVVDEKKDPNRTGFVHICIKVDSREKLDEIIAKFKAFKLGQFSCQSRNRGLVFCDMQLPVVFAVYADTVKDFFQMLGSRGE